MRTTKKEFKKQVQDHILSRLDEESGNSYEERLKATADSFLDWYGPYEQKMNPNRYNAFKEWMMGLPSTLNIEYTNYGIGETMKDWFESVGEEYKTPKDESKEVDLYCHLVTREFETLTKKNGIKFW